MLFRKPSRNRSLLLATTLIQDYLNLKMVKWSIGLALGQMAVITALVKLL
ncbi:hypothetical protein B0F88_10685 [Methylobacter tundripaludum]|uniref:Uncharacterized protein n=1 Tax=Methylobacter tundripaludum TaxID=173365 RepID=A0A2S6H2U8_9GAMM|nr:hypothetical protein B0F88_10685 [Methylobacter tundripaludum]